MMENKQAIIDRISNNINDLSKVDPIYEDATKRVEELKKTLGPCHEEHDTPEKRVACYLYEQAHKCM